MKESVKNSKQSSMIWKLMGILAVCWLVPFSIMFGVMVLYVATNHSDMTAENFRKQLEFNNQICMERLESVIEASRRASYDGELLNTYEMEEENRISPLAADNGYKGYLRNNYQKNNAISCTYLWFNGNKEEIYSVYNEGAFGSYQQVLQFKEWDYDDVKKSAEDLETRVAFLNKDGRLYLIRNLVNSRFEEKGSLVFLLNKEYCFGSLKEFPSQEDVYVTVNRETAEDSGSSLLNTWVQEYEGEGEVSYNWKGGRLYVTDFQKNNDVCLNSFMIMEKSITQYPFYGYQYVMGGLFFSLIPILAVLFWVFKKHIVEPVELLSDGAKHIEAGEIGYQIEETPRSYEFAYLRNVFNEMSQHLKQQFDKIYQEEIALREARIMALQSHINPHFMNNTLEIINWEARLSGNEKVSRMIEALSTMMDAAMDRRKRPEVRLAEEMRYVNSYLYITKERLGKRLTVKMELPDELMDYLVPRLILQPVVENAVEHGVVPNGSGTVTIRGYCDENYLYLETLNDGGMTKEDREKLEKLLGDDYENESGGSLGIANVNQRLRIFFGSPCGLTIQEVEKGLVLARITMPKHK